MSLIEDVGNSFLEGFNKGFSDARNRTIYLPIMCCGHEMSEIWQGDKRVGAFCPVCKKKWEPRPTEEHYTVGKMTVHIDEWDPKMAKNEEELINGVKFVVSDFIANDMAILFNSNLFSPDGTVDEKKAVVIKGLGNGEEDKSERNS